MRRNAQVIPLLADTTNILATREVPKTGPYYFDYHDMPTHTKVEIRDSFDQFML